MDAPESRKRRRFEKRKKNRSAHSKRRRIVAGDTIVLDAITKGGQRIQGDVDSPEGWARSVEALFKTRVAKRLQDPPDGPGGEPDPLTRRYAPGPEWRGVMVTDCGYETMRAKDVTNWSSPSPTDTGAPESQMAVWMTGRDEWGRSTCIWLHHMLPYFYVGIADPDPDLPRAAAERYATELKEALESRVEDQPRRGQFDVLEVRPVKRSWFYGYKPDKRQDRYSPRWNLDGGAEQQPWDGGATQASDWYLKVSLSAPYHVNKARAWCAEWARSQAGWRIPTVNTTSTVRTPVDLTVFEANVEFVLRVMVDLGLVGYGWCAIDAAAGVRQGLLGVVGEGDPRKRSRCDVEYVVDGRLFEEAMRAKDEVLLDDELTDTEPAWDAMRDALRRRDMCMRFVGREAKYQRYTDGVAAEEDPQQAWFEDLRDATAPLRIMSFDIECCNNNGSFPDPLDPDSQVVNLAARVYRSDQVEAYERERARYEAGEPLEGGYDVARSKHPPPFDAVVMGLGARKPMKGGGMDGYPVTSVAFATERELFIAFAKLMLAWDPDVIEGYNSVAFDMAYMLRRAEGVLKVEDVFWDIGRLPGRLAKPRNESFGNKAKGKRETWRAHIHGRSQLDIYVCVEGDIAYKPRSYRLNDVAHDLLGEGKYDMDYALIPKYHFGTPKTRRKLDRYCDADTALPFKIERKQSYLTRAIEMARVTGVPMNFYLTKGQQVLVYTQLLRKAKERAYAIPWIAVVEPEREETDARRVKAYQGAIVIEPKKGYYPITTKGVTAVLDFAALYPSEMAAENLGYTTSLTDPAAAARCRKEHARRHAEHDRRKAAEVDRFYDGEQQVRDYEREGGWKVAPVNAASGEPNPVFVRHHVRKSLLVEILEALTAARARAKKEMGKYPKGSALWNLWNARQMALKVCNNSVYGFTGAVVGRLPHLWISSATTGYGRVSLYFVVRLVDELLPGDNEVIYGDTDSVMVLIKDAATGEEDAEPGAPYNPKAMANIKMAFERAVLLAKEVNSRLVPPMELEMEKLFLKYLLLKKKKYMAEAWVKATEPYGPDAKGVEMVRRDNPLIVGMAQARFADILLGIGPKDPETGKRVSLYPDIELAKGFLTEVHRRILNAEGLPLAAYVISGRFSRPVDEYKDKGAHITLTERMLKRDPGSAPKLGDRVPYVIVESQHSENAQARQEASALVNERSEDPQRAERRGMTIDTEFYATKKFIPPFLRLLAPVEAAEELASAPPRDFKMATRQRHAYRHAPEKYDEWYERDRQATAEAIVHRRVFGQNYVTRKRRITVDTNTSIGKYMTRAHPPQNTGPDPDGDDDEMPEDEEDARTKIKRLLEEMYQVVRTRIMRERQQRKAAGRPAAAPAKASSGGQQSLLRFFGKVNSYSY